MKARLLTCVALLFLGICHRQLPAQTIVYQPDPAEKPGERPYEMVLADRREPAEPSLRFDQLQGWRMEVMGGAQASIQPSRARNIWDRPVGRLRYQGNGNKDSSPRIMIYQGSRITLPAGANTVEMWVNGNRWDWENPPDTPPVRISIQVRDATGQRRSVAVDTIRWQDWWLIHRRLPTQLAPPVELVCLEVSGGWQSQPRDIYFDSLRFFQEELSPVKFMPRPQRNLTRFEGQSAGANTGPGKLSFPTREETILPMHLGGAFQTHTTTDASAGYKFTYRGKDAEIVYYFDPARGLGSLRAELNRFPIGVLMDGASVKQAGVTNASLPSLISSRLRFGIVTADYNDGTCLRLQIWQKSLVVDVINRTGQASELQFGQVAGVQQPRLIWMPFLNYSDKQPFILLTRTGRERAFTSLWLDWYRSNGSEPYGGGQTTSNSACINGGVRYIARTDGQRNPMFERLFLTVSPLLEEVLPTIPNPTGLHAAQAVDRLWQESWGPDDYEKQMKRSRMLRAYGIEKLIQCNHEIAWRDGGESFTLRRFAAPKKGGDEALKQYVTHQRGLGWLAGLYSNYTDYAPVNEFWDPDGVQRQSNGDWRSAWPRCYALKPLKAVEFDAMLASQIKRKFNSNSAYTDVHTAVAPWNYVDYDHRVPGAGTFAQTLYAYGELLRNDSRVYNGPIFSEGSYHWLYAGLADGNYAIAYNKRPLAKEPLLPVFDLYQIHTRECDIGMGWTAFFCDAIPNWKAPENIDRSIDRFLLHTLAYGHIGWLMEEEHGLSRTCRSYYMLQPVQARYGLKAPCGIAYWNGSRLYSVSEAVDLELPQLRRQLLVEYPGGLKLWCNDHATENWPVRLGNKEVMLPPAGWAAFTSANDLVSYSALLGTNKVDYLRCPAYTYQDGRGQWFSTEEAASNGALAISPLKPNGLRIIRISGEGAFIIKRPYKTSGALMESRAYDVDGKPLVKPVVQDTGAQTRIEPVPGAVRYEFRYEGQK